MPTEITELQNKFCGEVFYDAECPLCLKGFMRFSGLFSHYGFHWRPMQTPGLAKRLGTTDDELRSEMKLLRPDGKLLGGIDTWSYMLRCVWWLWPLGAFLKLPVIHGVADGVYCWLARNRYCFGGHCALPVAPKRGFTRIELVACATLPLLAGIISWRMSGWIFMWATAIAMGFVGKWLTYRDALFHGARPTFSRFIIWFLGWPGMDGRAFLDNRATPLTPQLAEWTWAAGKLAAGILFFWFFAPACLPAHPWLAGWVAMTGIVLILHFGIFHLLSILWRIRGIDAPPIMRQPIFATSLARRWGAARAAFLIFLLSGLLHELVISFPARAGFGWPTAYFILQAVGIYWQSRPAMGRHGWDCGGRGWLFTVMFAALPA